MLEPEHNAKLAKQSCRRPLFSAAVMRLEFDTHPQHCPPLHAPTGSADALGIPLLYSPEKAGGPRCQLGDRQPNYPRPTGTSIALIVSSWPEETSVDTTILEDFTFVQEVIAALRNFRTQHQLGFKAPVELYVTNSSSPLPFISIISHLGFVEKIIHEDVTSDVQGGRIRVGKLSLFIPLAQRVDVAAERKKIEEELNYTQGFLASVEKKLSNERFVANAPEKVIALERKKAEDAQAKIKVLQENLAALNGE